MAILAECPKCHRKQSTDNKRCEPWAKKGYVVDLDKEKRAKKVRYWICYRVNGKQHWDFVGNDEDGKPLGIKAAQAAEGKRKAQKYENPGILKKVAAEKMTFAELAEWYLDDPDVKKLAYYRRIRAIMKNFNEVFGTRIVSSIKLEEVKKYQEKRATEGRAAATIDMEISIVKTMVKEAFKNDKVDERTLKAFLVKRRLTRGDNARKRTLAPDEYLRLIDQAAPHLKGIIIVAFNTGMRAGEIMGLKWSHIDRDHKFIRLPKGATKEGKDKVIPINHQVKAILAGLPAPLPPLRDDLFVFTYKGQPIGDIRTALMTACKKAGIALGRKEENGITFHDIRRTVKTNMVSAGIFKEYRDTILGHSLQGMDLHYIVPSEDDLYQAMEKYTEWIDGELKKAQDADPNLTNVFLTVCEK
jgi:integrase